MGSRKLFVAAAAAVLGLGVSSSRADVVLDFEGAGVNGGEGLGTNNGGAVGTFGATTGTKAFVFTNLAANAGTLFDIGTVNGTATGAVLDNYNALNNGVGLGGPGKFIQIDYSLDTTNVTGNGYYQFGIFGNSDNGFFGLGYGDLVNGYDILSGPLSLGGPAIAQGVTLTALDPYNPQNGDRIGTYRILIPISAQSATGNVVDFGPGADAANDFFQFGFSNQSGYAGSATFAIDNVQVGIPDNGVPEPTSLSLLGLGATALLRRRRA